MRRAGPKRTTCADCTASGRSLDFVEDTIRELVLPRYANTHTDEGNEARRTAPAAGHHHRGEAPAGARPTAAHSSTDVVVTRAFHDTRDPPN